MRILVAGIGSRGDRQPLELLARELARLGTDVDTFLPDAFSGIMADGGIRNLDGRHTVDAIWDRCTELGKAWTTELQKRESDALIFNPLIAPYLPKRPSRCLAVTPYPGPADDITWESSCGVPVAHAYSQSVFLTPGVYQPGYILDEPFLAGSGDTNLPIYVGFGSVAVSERFIAEVEDSIKAAGRDVVRPTGPHSASLAHVSAVVHHGGAGTTAACLRAGKPQVIIPFLGDQFLWGMRMSDLGVGRLSNAQNVGRDVTELLSDERCRRNLNSLSDVLETDAAAVLASVITKAWA